MKERLYEPFQQIYKKLEMDYEEANRNLLLKIAVKVIDDTIGENGLALSRFTLLITEIFPIKNCHNY